MARRSKLALFQQVEQAIRLSGWWFLTLPISANYYRQYQVYTEAQSFPIRVYIWNVSHGGGAARPADEYRIQVTGLSQFIPEQGGKTLILGWWDEVGVFVGFDYTRHSGPLGFSPSLQVSVQALGDAHRNGFATYTKGTGETAITFRPDFFGHYTEHLESLHKCGESPQTSTILQRIGENPYEVLDEDIEDVPQERQYAVVTTRKALREASFRDRVLTAYSHRCAMCGMQLKLLDAAHILPVQHPESTDGTNNGMSLCTLHHRAFDRGLVTFNQRYHTRINESKVVELQKSNLDGGLDRFRRDLKPLLLLPPDNRDHPRQDFIEEANKIRGWDLA